VGELAALTAAALWAGASLLYARARAPVGPNALNLFKTALALLLLGLTAATLGALPFALAPAALGWLGLSGVIGLCLGDSLFFVALERLGAGRTLLVWALNPAATSALGALVLDEPVGLPELAGLALTGAGVLWVLRERPPGERPAALGVGVLAALGAVLCQASGSVTAKLGGAGLGGLEVTLVRLAVGTAALVLLVGVRGELPELLRLRGRALVPLVAAVLAGSYLGLWLYMFALGQAPAGVVATLGSTSPIFVLALSRVFLGERTGPRALGGAALAVAGVAVLGLAR
jgi:drug/metabolite transporter (DMT)-like permease